MVDVVCCKIKRSVSYYFCASTYRFELAPLDFMPFQSCFKVESKTRNSQLLALRSVGLRPPSLRFRQIASVKTALQNLDLAYTGLC